ncbi:MAG: hypothetical protein GY746_07520 [Gammaproteobacteria bacterium]|nr:hypothetical protein [Gammaproteobacteria bacterium]
MSDGVLAVLFAVTIAIYGWMFIRADQNAQIHRACIQAGGVQINGDCYESPMRIYLTGEVKP